MRLPRLIPVPVYATLLCAASAGCLTMNQYQPAEVVVRDAETKQPIPEASVRIAYPTTRSSFAPHESSGKTSLDGVARLELAPSEESCILLDASAPGFMSIPMDISAEARRQIVPTPWYSWTKQSPGRFVVEMYAEPRFCIEFTLPNGFRGLVKAEVEFQDQLTFPTGQRCFSYAVAATGTVPVRAPGSLRRFLPRYRARYADGTTLTEEMDALKIGFRWLKGDGNDEYFVVGTQTDFENYSRELSSTHAGIDKHSSDAGKGRGRGGRRNRGDPTSSQSQ